MARVAPAEPQRPRDPHDVVFAVFVVFVGFVDLRSPIVVKGKPKLLFDRRCKEMVWVEIGGGYEYD